MPAVSREDVDELQSRLDELPRVRLAHLPTPLDECANLSAILSRRISIKRDDCTGLAFGGNKSRQLEFMLGDALAQGADCIIQGAASQSNHSRQLAAAGAKLGLDVFLLPKADEFSSPIQGNYLIHHLLGATIMPIGPEESSKERKEQLAEKLRSEGRRPYVVGMGAARSLTLATLAYVETLLEIVTAHADGPPDWIFATSQGSTIAGLQLGSELLGLPTRVVGICPMTDQHEAYLTSDDIAGLAQGAASMLGVDSRITANVVTMTTDYVGQGYGVPSGASLEAIGILGSAEGILLDPIYSGKGFAGLLDYCRRNIVASGERVVFVHTGGLPALFRYSDKLLPPK